MAGERAKDASLYEFEMEQVGRDSDNAAVSLKRGAES